MQLERQTIRIPVHTDKRSAIQDLLTNRSPSAWRGNDLSFQVALMRNRLVLNIDNLDQVSVTVKAIDDRTGATLMTKTVAYANLNRALTDAQWTAGTAQHVTVEFTKEETRLAMGGADEVEFWLVVHGLTTDTPSRELTFGAGVFTMFEDGVGGDDDSPVIGASVIPTGATYDVDGNYVFTGATVGRVYSWTPGDNDTDITDDVTTYTANPSRFTATSTSFVLTGTAGELVTAQLQVPSYYTADEADARFQLAWELAELEAAIEAAQAAADAAQETADDAFGEWFTAASQAAMLALDADKGDRCVRTDLAPRRIYQLTDWPASTLSNWQLEPVVFNWIDAAWDSGTTYNAGDALTVGVNTLISQTDGNLNNDPTDTDNIGEGEAWGYLAKGSSLQLTTATPTSITPTSGTPGVGPRAAREDHSHPCILATQSSPGLMAAADKLRFDNTETGFANLQVSIIKKSVDGNWLYIVGSFTAWDNTEQGTIVRVDRRGRIDPFWNIGDGFNAVPNHVVPLPDGRLLVGYQNSKISLNGATAQWVWILDETGAVDATWNSPAAIASTGTDALLGLAYLSDGDGRVAMLSWRTLRVADMQGTTEFLETFNANAHWLSSYDCQLLVSSRPTASYGAVLNPQAVKLLDFCEDAYGAYTGDVEATFAANGGSGWAAAANYSIFAPDGSFAIVGGALSYEGTSWAWNAGTEVSKGLLKVYTDGANSGLEVPGWSVTLVMASASEWPRPLAVDSQGRVYFTGNITSINGTAVTANRLYRVDSTGGNLKEFADFDGAVNTLEVVADDKLIAGGAFTHYGVLAVGFAVMIDDTGARIHHLLEPDTPVRVGVLRERYVDASAMAPSATDGATAVITEGGTNGTTRDFYAFAYDAESSVEFDTKLPAEWDGGAVRVRLDLFPQPAGTPGNGMVFEVQAVATGNNESDDPTLPSGAVIIDTLLTVPAHHLTASAVLNIGGTPQPGDLLHFRITRRVDHASDTAGGDVYLKGLGIQYQESETEPTAWA